MTCFQWIYAQIYRRNKTETKKHQTNCEVGIYIMYATYKDIINKTKKAEKWSLTKKEKKNRHMKKLVERLWKFYPGEEKILICLCKIKSFM